MFISERNIEKKEHGKCDFLNVFVFFFTVRVVLYAHLAHLVGCSREKHEKCRRFKVTRSPRALTIFIENNLIIIFLFHIS